MKFLILLKKELRDIASAHTLITFGVMFLMLFAIGGFTGNIAKEAAASQSAALTVLDKDKSALSAGVLAFLEQEGGEIELIDAEDQAENYLVIPAGFEAGILAGTPQTVERVSTLKSLSVMESVKLGGGAAVTKINGYISRYLAENQYNIADVTMLTTPVTAQYVTVVAGRSAGVSPGDLVTALMNSSVFVPMIVMLLTMFSAQMISTAVSNEKTDKTLETLMSTPVSKMEILFSKILSAGIIAAAVSAVFTLVLSGSSLLNLGAVSGEQGGVNAALAELNLTLTPGRYALLGVDILLTVAISLCIAFILTIIAPDAKPPQITTYPLVILTILPYMLAIFVDINSLPTVPKLLMFLIPFTHTFAAASNILFGNMGLYLFGVGYQVVFLAATVLVTVKIFSSDVIFTGIKKKTRKKAPNTL